MGIVSPFVVAVSLSLLDWSPAILLMFVGWVFWMFLGIPYFVVTAAVGGTAGAMLGWFARRNGANDDGAPSRDDEQTDDWR